VIDEERALAIVARVSGRPRAGLAPETDLVADLGLDSLRSFELVVELEEAFGVALADDQVRGIRTVGDALQALERAAAA
jgi:acyl carrier protein